MPNVNSSSLKSNKNFVGFCKAIVTRCPSSEPDPDGDNRIQICIPNQHGIVNENMIGSGSNPGQYPWARMVFGANTAQTSESSISDLTELGNGSELINKKYDANYKSVKYSLTDSQRTYIEKIVTGEFGSDYTGSCLIAQCMRDAITSGMATASTIKTDMGYDGWKDNITDNAKKAVKYIFDEGNCAVHHRILYMCTEEIYNPGTWHYDASHSGSASTIEFILQHQNVVFFDKISSSSSSNKSRKTRTIDEPTTSTEFKPRTDDKGLSGKYWTSDNPFYQSGYGMPNCTCYAWGRAYEILGNRPNLPTCDAGGWVNALNGAYPVSKTPQLGDIGCWSGGSNGGHVAVIEQLSEDGKTATLSESAWQGFNFLYGSTVSESNGWMYGNGYTLNGFIHIGNYSTSSEVSIGGISSDNTSYDPYPKKGDTVWVSFEGGDIRYPIIQGFMKPQTGSSALADLSKDGTLAKLAADIIIYEHTKGKKVYDSITCNKDSFNIGILDFCKDRAKDVIQKIYDTDKSSFDNVSGSKEIAKKLKESWAEWVITKDSDIYKSIKGILGINASKTVQDQVSVETVQSYIDAAEKLKISDNGALIYAADIYDQGKLDALKLCLKASSKPITLSSLHNGTMSTYMGKDSNSDRRNRVLNKIKDLESSGKLTEISSASGQAAKVVAIAKAEIGYKAADHGGATKYGQWYGTYTGWGDYSYEAWCAMFTQWCMYQAGVTKDQIAVTAAAGDSGRGAWHAKELWHDRSGFTPKPGDLIHYTWGHVGIVEAYKNGKVYTIEGNTGSSPGCVGTHEYDANWSSIAGYARPKYK